MAGITRKVLTSARYLYAVESLGKERGAGTGFLGVTGGRADRAGGAFSRFDGSQGASRRARGIKKKRETGDREESGRLEYEYQRVSGERPGGCGVQSIDRERG
jgi:hypothetical protein